MKTATLVLASLGFAWVSIHAAPVQADSDVSGIPMNVATRLIRTDASVTPTMQPQLSGVSLQEAKLRLIAQRTPVPAGASSAPVLSGIPLYKAKLPLIRED